MQVNQSWPGSSQPRLGNRRPADPGLSAAEDPVDTCTLSRPSFDLPGESLWHMQKALYVSNYDAQLKAAQGLLAKARQNRLLTPDEQKALHTLTGRPQANGSFQVAAYHKAEKGVGPAKVYQKSEVGYEAGHGGYVASQVGAEVKVGLPGIGPSATFYSRTTTRTGQEKAEAQSGVELEKSLGPASVGMDLSNQGLGGSVKLESPALGGRRVGLEANASVPTRGNAPAREAALNAIHQQTTNLVARNLGLH